MPNLAACSGKSCKKYLPSLVSIQTLESHNQAGFQISEENGKTLSMSRFRELLERCNSRFGGDNSPIGCQHDLERNCTVLAAGGNNLLKLALACDHTN